MLKPYHVFEIGGKWYLINVNNMCAHPIDEKLAYYLKEVSETHLDLTSLEAQVLRRLRLLSLGSCLPKKGEESETPITNMALFLTQSCNLRCVYCYEDHNHDNFRENMDEATAFKAVDWLMAQSGSEKDVHIGFFGGEPFLRFDLMKALVDYAKRQKDKNVDFYATTNATLLDDDCIAFIRDTPVSVTVSIDGPEHIQDTQRPFQNGKGSYHSIAPRIKRLLEVAPKTPAHAVLLGNTDPKLIRDSLQDMGFRDITIAPASESLFGNKEGGYATSRNTKVILQRLEEEAETWLHLSHLQDNEALSRLKTSGELFGAIDALLHNRRKRFACGAGRQLVAVSTIGDVYLCHRFIGQEKYRLGSMFYPYLERSQYQKSPTIHSEKCSSCFAKFYCGGGCKHDNASSCGSVTHPAEDICHLSRRALELGAYVLCNLSPKSKVNLTKAGVFSPVPCPLDF